MNYNYLPSLSLYKNFPDSTKFDLKKQINKSAYGLLSSKNQNFLVSQHGSALDSLWGGELQAPQTPAAFNTPFFSRITIEKLIQTLNLCIYKSKKHSNSRYTQQ